MTVEEKRIALDNYCDSCDSCGDCPLCGKCVDISVALPPLGMDDDDVEKLYTFYENLKGDKTMEERTITITTHEYKGLVADQAILAKLEVYTETHEFLNDDFIRTLLGTKKPHPVQFESEGD